MARKNFVRVTYFMRCGYRIFSWSALKQMVNGVCFARMNHRALQIVTVINSVNYIFATNQKVVSAELLKHRNCGLQLWNHKLKPAHLTCFIKMPATKRAIRKILGRLK